MKLFNSSIALFVILSLIMPHAQIKAGELPLSYESKKFIAIAAVLGGALAGGIGFAIGCDEQAQNKALANAVFWDKIKSFPWSYVIFPTLIGALVSGGISSFFTTEAWTSFDIFTLILDIKFIDINKNIYYKKRVFLY